MADRQVTIKLSAQDQFSGTLDKYKQKMGEAATATRNTNESTGQLENGYRRMQQAFDVGIAGAMISRVQSFAEEFNDLGTQVNAAEITFEQLNGGVEQSDRLMSMLEESTNGVVDQMTLMQGANQLLSMGIATNSDEVARLTELAVKLGGAMGNDAGQSIADFGTMLANDSVLRLDTFGISSSRVKERMDELLASGEALNRSEAFRLATLEVGADSLERLGDAANVSATPLAQFQTRMENIFQEGAQNFSVGVNSIIGFFDAVGDAAERNADKAERIQNMLRLMGVEAVPLNEMNNGAANPGIEAAIRFQELLHGGSITATNATDQQYQDALLGLQVYDRINGSIQQGTRWLSDQITVYRENQRAAETLELTERNRTQYLGEMRGHYQQLYSTFEGAGGTSSLSMTGDWSRDLEFIDPSKTQNTLNQIMAIRTALDSAQSANEQGLLSDQDLAQMESMALAAEDFASAIEAGVDRFEHMTLPQALGEGTGNELLGGISDQVMAALQERGNLDAEALQSTADAYDLASGRINEVTLTMRDTIVPILADLTEQNTALGVERAAQVEGFLRRGAEMGLGPQAMSWGATLSTGALPVGDNVFDFQSILLDPFADAFDQIRSDVAGMGEETDLGAMTFSEMPTGITKSVEEAGVLEEVLNRMAENKYTIRVHIDDSELTAFEGRVAALGGIPVNGGVTPGAGPAVERVVRDNGGQVPGSDNRGRGNVGFRPMN